MNFYVAQILNLELFYKMIKKFIIYLIFLINISEIFANSLLVKDATNDTIGAEQENTVTKQLQFYNTAQVIALNKITAQSQLLTLKLTEPKYFGNIEIVAHKCLKDNNPYSPDNKILLSIIERKIDEEHVVLFQGWMMSSSISLSTFEHPVYEVFAKNCL